MGQTPTIARLAVIAEIRSPTISDGTTTIVSSMFVPSVLSAHFRMLTTKQARGGKRTGAGRKPSDPLGEPRVHRVTGLTETEKRIILDFIERIRREAEDAKRDSN